MYRCNYAVLGKFGRKVTLNYNNACFSSARAIFNIGKDYTGIEYYILEKYSDTIHRRGRDEKDPDNKTQFTEEEIIKYSEDLNSVGFKHLYLGKKETLDEISKNKTFCAKGDSKNMYVFRVMSKDYNRFHQMLATLSMLRYIHETAAILDPKMYFKILEEVEGVSTTEAFHLMHFQGKYFYYGGSGHSLAAWREGMYLAKKEDLSRYFRRKGKFLRADEAFTVLHKDTNPDSLLKREELQNLELNEIYTKLKQK